MATVADETGVRALVAGRDEAGTARARSVSAGVHDEPGVLDERIAALGEGASSVLGHLETAGEVDLESAEVTVRAAAARDPGTGEALDVWRLADENG